MNTLPIRVVALLALVVVVTSCGSTAARSAFVSVPASTAASTSSTPESSPESSSADPVSTPPALPVATTTALSSVAPPSITKAVAKPPVTTAIAPAAPPPPPTETVFANCTAMHQVYPHGVGRAGAVDQVSGTSKPVTDFHVDTALYNANAGSDADGDGIACEKQ